MKSCRSLIGPVALLGLLTACPPLKTVECVEDGDCASGSCDETTSTCRTDGSGGSGGSGGTGGAGGRGGAGGGGGCVSTCSGRECGHDGCVGTCGECGLDERCVDFRCEPIGCTRDCLGKQCGDDGCGDTCGDCDLGKSCDAGSCVDGCPADREPCGGGCVDLRTDPANCGSCGNSCLGAGCASGTCLPCECTADQCGELPCGASCGACTASGAGCESNQCVVRDAPSGNYAIAVFSGAFPSYIVQYAQFETAGDLGEEVVTLTASATSTDDTGCGPSGRLLSSFAVEPTAALPGTREWSFDFPDFVLPECSIPSLSALQSTLQPLRLRLRVADGASGRLCGTFTANSTTIGDLDGTLVGLQLPTSALDAQGITTAFDECAASELPPPPP